jgi:hypothetical protein
MFSLPGGKSRVSVDFLVGRETAAEYVAREIPAAAALAAASTKLPLDTLVGYVGRNKGWDGAQIYTESRLTYFAPHDMGTTPEVVLANLDQLGIDYLIWDRELAKPEDWRSTLLSTEFLRDHSRILEGNHGAYLFEMLPDDELTWGAKHLRNLLDDPGLDEVKRQGGPWTIVGKVIADDGVVSMRTESSIAQRIPVSGGRPYLLTVSATCSDATDSAELSLRWFDGGGVTIGVASELVIPGTEGSEQFLWRRAPDRATSASVELTSRRCEFDLAELYDLS